MTLGLDAKLADFGPSKIFPTDGDTHVSKFNVAGTPGYVDPSESLHQFNYRLQNSLFFK